MSDDLNESPLLSIMLGTAGHVDHGKTSLVRNLTGFDTDRHPEERERGMSIDFAVAPLQLPDRRLAGVIDVPGHEDFIRNMVSGASAIDLLLLVVAADDAVMPQTEEHVRIAKALGLAGIITVVTKIDLVTPDLLDVVEGDVRTFLREAGFPDAPIVRVSNTTREGIDELLDLISALVKSLRIAPDERAFRMPIRQIFTVKGHGIVVTGVPLSGHLAPDDEAEILPAKIPVTVRSIQNYKRSTGSAEPHRSSAINLRAQVEPDAVTRGMTLAEPNCYFAPNVFVAWFRNDSRDQSLLSRKDVIFHAGTFRSVGRVRLIDCGEAVPGQEAFLRLKLQHQVCLAAGDRFVIRSHSRNLTYGGGRVLSVHVPRSRRLTEALFDRLIRAKDAVEQGGFFLAELLAGSKFVLTREELKSRSQLPPSRFPSEVERLVELGELNDLGDGGYLVHSRRDELRETISRSLQRYHAAQKFAWGMKPTYVCDLLGLPHGSFPSLERMLLEEPGFSMKAGRLALEGYSPPISAREIRLRDDILRLLERAGVQSLARGNVMEQLQLDEKELKGVLKLLIEEELVVMLGTNLLLRSTVNDLKAALLELFKWQTVVDLGQFREKTGTSRNVAALVLDSFDAAGLTRRTEAGRTLVRKK